MTHSLLFAAVIAVIMAFRFGPARAERLKLALLLFVITASHGVLDALTNGGLGVAFFSPFDTRRYFFPWTPIQVSPIGASGFFSPRGINVLWSEIVWVWGPAIVLGTFLWAMQRTRKSKAQAMR